mmetsp:Transcript_28440/g.66734  ORF Transcript_28440/g.66734 Transcript_28440/m.66734 type:complete len:193 (+) Transcript_28440:919-1497(+)
MLKIPYFRLYYFRCFSILELLLATDGDNGFIVWFSSDLECVLQRFATQKLPDILPDGFLYICHWFLSFGINVSKVYFMAPASPSMSLSFPLNAKSTIPGATSESMPPSKPPMYSPPTNTNGTEVRPTFLPKTARIGFPSSHGSSRRTILTSAPIVSNASTAFLHDGEFSQVYMTQGAEAIVSSIPLDTASLS